jgi:flagellar biosynthesis protein FliR
VILPATAEILAVAVLYCRIGSCVMVMPGLSSQQLPARVRLMIGIACTLVMAPALAPQIAAHVEGITAQRQLALMVSEMALGLLLGSLGRFYFAALEFAAASISTYLGFGGTPGVPLEDLEPSSSLATFISLTATLLIFVMDLHLEVVRALFDSYKTISVAAPFEPAAALSQLVAVAGRAFVVAVQLSSPFIVFSISVNLLFGLVNKLLPQVQVYFVSVPFVMIGGLVMLVAVSGDLMLMFMNSYGHWLKTGHP